MSRLRRASRRRPNAPRAPAADGCSGFVSFGAMIHCTQFSQLHPSVTRRAVRAGEPLRMFRSRRRRLGRIASASPDSGSQTTGLSEPHCRRTHEPASPQIRAGRFVPAARDIATAARTGSVVHQRTVSVVAARSPITRAAGAEAAGIGTTFPPRTSASAPTTGPASQSGNSAETASAYEWCWMLRVQLPPWAGNHANSRCSHHANQAAESTSSGNRSVMTTSGLQASVVARVESVQSPACPGNTVHMLSILLRQVGGAGGSPAQRTSHASATTPTGSAGAASSLDQTINSRGSCSRHSTAANGRASLPCGHQTAIRGTLSLIAPPSPTPAACQPVSASSLCGHGPRAGAAGASRRPDARSGRCRG